MADDLEYRIGRLRLEPGDILVVKTEQDIPASAWVSITAQFKDMVPDNRLLLVSGDVELSVLTQSQIAARAA